MSRRAKIPHQPLSALPKTRILRLSLLLLVVSALNAVAQNDADCPIASYAIACTTEYAPVECSHDDLLLCRYNNECLASSAGWNVAEKCQPEDTNLAGDATTDAASTESAEAATPTDMEDAAVDDDGICDPPCRDGVEFCAPSTGTCMEWNCLNWAADGNQVGATADDLDQLLARYDTLCDEEPDTAMFCGRDGSCYPYSCEMWYQWGPTAWTGYKDENPIESLTCTGYSDGQNPVQGVQMGCDSIHPQQSSDSLGKLTVVAETYNQRCIAINETTGTVEFECFSYLEQSQNWDSFLQKAESFFPDCNDTSSTSQFFYPITRERNGFLVTGVQSVDLGEGPFSSVTAKPAPTSDFEESSAYGSMYARANITQTEIVGLDDLDNSTGTIAENATTNATDDAYLHDFHVQLAIDIDELQNGNGYSNVGAAPHSFVSALDKLFFISTVEAVNYNIFTQRLPPNSLLVYDGNTTTWLEGISVLRGSILADHVINGKLMFFGSVNGQAGSNLLATDGTMNGTRKWDGLAAVDTGLTREKVGQVKSTFVGFNDLLYFFARDETMEEIGLYSFDGRDVALDVVLDVSYGQPIGEMVVFQDRLYFLATPSFDSLNAERHLQSFPQCSLDDDAGDGDRRFACNVTSEFSTSDGSITSASSQINCLLDEDIGMNYQQSEDCQCEATLTQMNGAKHICPCSPCAAQSWLAVAVDCRNNENDEDKYVFSPCMSIDCNGDCTESGENTLGRADPGDIYKSLVYTTTDRQAGAALAFSAPTFPGSVRTLIPMAFPVQAYPTGAMLVFTTSPAELYITDGTSVKKLYDVGAPTEYLTWNDELYFVSDYLFKTNGVVVEQVEEFILQRQFTGRALANLGDSLLLAAQSTEARPDRPAGIYRSDGTLNSAELLKEISTVGPFVIYEDRAFFPADNGAIGVELFMTDGTVEGTVLLADIEPAIVQRGNAEDPVSSEPMNDARTYYKDYAIYNDEVYFAAFTQEYGREIWKLCSESYCSTTQVSEDLDSVVEAPDSSTPIRNVSLATTSPTSGQEGSTSNASQPTAMPSNASTPAINGTSPNPTVRPTESSPPPAPMPTSSAFFHKFGECGSVTWLSVSFFVVLLSYL